MKSSYSVFMQSRFFDPMFNSAVFDGPFRIYFNQMHESLALKIYFMINQKLESLCPQIREMTKRTDSHAFILIYPNASQFQHIFSKERSQCQFLSESSCMESWDQDLVFGLEKPLSDQELIEFMDQVKIKVEAWYHSLLAAEAAMVSHRESVQLSL